MRLRALFIPTANSGVTWYRMQQFWVGAARQGIADFHVLWWQKNLTEMHPWERDIQKTDYMWRITKEMQDWAVQSDVIIFGMLHGPGVKVVGQDYVSESIGIFRAMRDMFPNKPIFTEVDDNFISAPHYNPAFKMYAPEQELRQLAIAQIKESTGVIVSTPYLSEVYGEFNPNVHVIENCIDFKAWDTAPRKRKKGIRIGWAGGANHGEDFEVLKTVIPKIRAKYPECTFVFLHGCPPEFRTMPGVEYHKEWAHIDKYPKKLASLGFDIGIAPLVDNAFNRGKSNLRWLEYSALGIPTVASKVGHFAQTINDGIDGFLAENAVEFEGYLEALIKDKSLRRTIGGNAYRRIRHDFNVDGISGVYTKVLESERDKAAEKMAAEAPA